jgi:hypothetical protein
MEDWDSAADDAERFTIDKKCGWIQAGWWIIDAESSAATELDPFDAATDSLSNARRWYVSADDPNGFVPLHVSASTYVSRVYSPHEQSLEVDLTPSAGLDAHLWLNGKNIDSPQKARLYMPVGWTTFAVRVEEQTQSSNVLLRPGNGFYLRLRAESESR